MLHQSRAAETSRAPVAGQAGVVMATTFSYTFSTAFTAATDILELGMLPAFAKPLRATVVGEGFGGAITADVGFLDGAQGAKDDTRALTGTEFFNDANVNGAEADTTAASMLALAATDNHRGIGVELSVNVAAGAAKKIHLILEYTY